MDVSIIIVNWNAGHVLGDCLRSIELSLQGSDLEVEVILVDNGSTDQSLVQIKEKHPEVRVIENQTNLGFSKACNLGAADASGRCLLFLNPDTEISPGSIDQMADFLENHCRAAVVGPMICNSSGTLEQSAYPELSFWGEFFRLFHLNRLNPGYDYQMERWDTTHPREVDVLQGACLMVRSKVFKELGSFDEQFFIYTEEVDFCCRIQKAGWQIFWLPWIVVTHLGAQSTQLVADKMFLELYRSKILYFRKHKGAVTTFFYKILLFLVSSTRQLMILSAGFSRKSEDRLRTAARYRRLILKLAGY